MGKPDHVITIRLMNERDDEAVRLVSAACYRVGAERDRFTENQLQTALRDHCSLQHMARLRQEGALVAEYDGAVAGVIAAKADSIQALFVDLALHRNGIGRALFEQAEDRIAKEGFSALSVKTTESAVPFYTRMGMERTGTWSPTAGPFAGMPLTVLTKKLNGGDG